MQVSNLNMFVDLLHSKVLESCGGSIHMNACVQIYSWYFSGFLFVLVPLLVASTLWLP